ncbi:hypothetical protein [Sphingomonas sp. 3P27F8]|uniref:hypothetical protein n=1 Tax=Sphingomonas sp. 3P27F8 TaxID=2502213 RepID=UPI002015E9D7|nr:hypothetical protein [Sphingomonas sp. 3P27F8]
MGVALLATGASAVARPDDNGRGEAKLAKIIDGRIAGKPVDCVDLQRIDSTEIIDGTAIVYRDGNRLYVNRPRSGRESLDSDDILSTKAWSTQLCNIDIVRLIDRTSYFPRGSVGLGEFVPYTKHR